MDRRDGEGDGWGSRREPQVRFKYFFFCFIIIIIDVFLGVAYFAPGTGRKRPQNRPKRRVWRRLGLRYLFVNIFPAFSKLTKIFMLSSFYLCLYLCITSTTRAWRGNKEKNGPKQCEMRRLGHCGAYCHVT